MPGEDGVTLLRALRECGHRAPAILVAARVEGRRVAEALAAGDAAATLDKPLRPRELVELAERLCHGGEARRAVAV